MTEKRKSIIFVPTIQEAEAIFEGINFIKNRYDLFEGDFSDTKVVVSGITKTNIAYASTIMFHSYSFKNAFLIGIAGCYRNSNLTIGEVVCVENDYFVDEGLLIEGVLKMTNEIGFSVCNDNTVQFQTIKGSKIVNANTVSFLSSFDKLAEIYFTKTGAEIENMEGAAFGLICERFKIPAYHIRGISNYCGDRKNQKWDLKKSFLNLKLFVKKVLFFKVQ